MGAGALADWAWAEAEMQNANCKMKNEKCSRQAKAAFSREAPALGSRARNGSSAQRAVRAQPLRRGAGVRLVFEGVLRDEIRPASLPGKVRSRR